MVSFTQSLCAYFVAGFFANKPRTREFIPVEFRVVHHSILVFLVILVVIIIPARISKLLIVLNIYLPLLLILL